MIDVDRRSRGGRFGFPVLSLLLTLIAGCSQPRDPDALQAALLADSVGRGAPEPVRDTVRFVSRDGELNGGEPTIIEAAVLHPAGRGPFPAVVALHDCQGLYGPSGAMMSHMRDWSERLAAQGYAVLMPDSFNPRGVPEMCSRDPELIRAGVERARDAAGGLDWLQAQPWIKPDKIGLIGWANGGTTALTFATTNGRLVRQHEQPDFKLIVAFYPNCTTMMQAPGWRSDIPLTVLTAGKDDWAPPQSCLKMSEMIQASNGVLDLVKYSDARHDFDAPNMPIHMKAGITTTATGSATIGTDPMARADAVERMTTLLSAALNP